jgi:hypothetical protein
MARKFSDPRPFAWLAILAVVLSAIGMVLLHVLVPQADPVSEMMPAYLDTGYHWLFRASVVLIGCAIGALSLGLYFYSLSGIWFKVALALAGIGVIGSLSISVAPDVVASLATALRSAIVLAVLVLSLRLRREPPWQFGGPLLLVTAIGLIVVLVSLRLIDEAGFGGLANRAALILIYAWVLLISRGLLASRVKELARAA